MFDYIMFGILIILSWTIIGIIMNTLYQGFGINYFIIKLPKHKKYQHKVNPIYKIEQRDYSKYYLVYKWELKYDINENINWFSDYFIPLPIVFHTYGYYKLSNGYKICELSEINTITPEYMIQFYENCFQNEIEQRKICELESLIKETRIDYLNKTFNENYE